MKDSGVTWIKWTASSWRVGKLGSYFRFQNTKVSDKDFEPLSVTYGGIKKQVENAAKSDNGENRKLLRSGNLAINGRSDRMGAAGMSPYDGSVSLIYHVLEPSDKDLHAKFYHYLIRSSLFSQEFYKWGRGIVADLWTTRTDEMKQIQIPVPPISDQKRIVDFLDEKIAVIDEVVKKKKTQIELLKEKRVALIFRAVTKGLDLNVQMKSSGVEWIGEIPKQWELQPLKRYVAFQGGDGFPETLQGRDNGERPFFKVSDINGSERRVDSAKNYVSLSDAQENNWHQIPKGAILMAKIGAALMKNHRKVAAVDCFIDNNTLAVIPKHNIDNEYLYWVLNTIDAGDIQNISTVPSINMNLLRNRLITLPENTEQKRIADLLNSKTVMIDGAIKKIYQSIKLIQEYRSSLISHAVTGKIIV